MALHGEGVVFPFVFGSGRFLVLLVHLFPVLGLQRAAFYFLSVPVGGSRIKASPDPAPPGYMRSGKIIQGTHCSVITLQATLSSFQLLESSHVCFIMSKVVLVLISF